MEHTTPQSFMDKMDNFTWILVPSFVYKRVSKNLGMKLTDGHYLSGVSKLFSLLPFLLLIAGWKIGASHYSFENNNNGIELIFTSSLPLMVFIVLAAFLSASFGFWLWMGYAMGDLLYFTLFTHIKGTFLPDLSFLAFIKKVWVPHLIPVLLFYFLAVNMRFVGKKLAIKVNSGRKSVNKKKDVLLPIFLGLWCGIIMYGWAAAAPILTLPVYTWPAGGDPVSAGLVPPLEYKWIIITIVVLMAMVRQFFDQAMEFEPERSMAFTPVSTGQVSRPVKTSSAGKNIVSVLTVTVMSTFLFSGLYQDWWDALYTGLFISGITLVMKFVVPALDGLHNLAVKVPLLFRFFVAGLVSWLIADNLITKGYFPVMLSYWPFLKSLFISILVFIVFVPDLTTTFKTKTDQ